MVLLTSLLTVHTNDGTNNSNKNLKTIISRPTRHSTADARDSHTSSRLLLTNNEESYPSADIANPPANKENESAINISIKDNNVIHGGDDLTLNAILGIRNEYRNGTEENILIINNNKEADFNKDKKKNYNNNLLKNSEIHKSSNSTKPTGKKLDFGNKFSPIVEHIFVEEEEEDVDDEVVIEIIDENEDFSKSRITHLPLREGDMDNAVEFGMKVVDDLVKIKEPMWFNMGLVLDKDDPASKVAAFGTPNKLALKLSQFGFLTLEASKKIAQSFPENVSRQAADFSGSFTSRLLQNECPLRGLPRCPPASKRYRTADGTCNNLEQPWRGSAMLPMQRFLPPMYEDGIQSIRRSVFGSRLPSAREVSVRIHRDRNHEIPSVTLMFMQWGQFIDHDITSAVKSRSFNGSIPRCCDMGRRGMLPPELMHPVCLPIEISDDDWFFGQFGVRCMEFIRSAPSTRINCDLGWREQINQVTPYIDASTIYGSDIETSDSIRTFRSGKIIYGRAHIQGPLRPQDPPEGELCRLGALTDDCFLPGDGRVAEQPGLTAMHTVWVRFHNKVATILSSFNTHWSDEKIFQETRKITYSIIQHITYREFLPIVLGPEVMELFELNLVRKNYYGNYNSRVNPSIANSFSTAAYRFGHSMVPNSYVRTDHLHRPLFNNVTLHEELNNFENIWSFGSVDRLLLGFINQPSQRRDEFVSDELTNHLFQSSNAPFGMDLAAINIQRGRDHGIPPYTSWRQPCGLSPVRNWKDLERIFSFDTAQRFRVIYQHVDDIDLFSGGLAEKPVRGGVVGPTFACIIAQQFLNLRKGDRFWYENGQFDSSFTPAQLQQIRHVTFSQILCETMGEIETVQPFVFLTADNFRNVRLPCDSPMINNFDLAAWLEQISDDIDNKIDFTFRKKRLSKLNKLFTKKIKRHARKTKTKATTVKPNSTKSRAKPTRKKSTKTPLKINISNVTTGTVKVENKYGGSNHLVSINSVPLKPTYHDYRPQNVQPDMTYLLGVAPSKVTAAPAQKPLEVNIKIQYLLPTTTVRTSTRKKKKRPTNRPSITQNSAVLITQRPVTKRPELSYPLVVQSHGYDEMIVRPNNLFEKPTNRPRPIYSYDDNRRPTDAYNRPSNAEDVFIITSNNYNPSNSYNIETKPNINNRPNYESNTFSYSTTNRPYSNRPMTSYDYYDPVFEDESFSTSKRPYVYKPQSNHYLYSEIYTTSRPRPQQSNYDYSSSNNYNYNNKQPTQQTAYDRVDHITEENAHALNNYDIGGEIPKKPSFGSVDHGGSTNIPTTYFSDKKQNVIYSNAHIHKLDNVQINDKLDFKTKLVTRRDMTGNNDKTFVKISSVKAEAIIEDIDSSYPQTRGGDLDLHDRDDNDINEDKIRVVEIDVAPSEVKDSHWLVYNATEDIMPLLPVPEINVNISCSSELPKPMNFSVVSQKLEKDSGTR